MTIRNAIADYMIPVADKAIKLLNYEGDDNFMEALQLNKTILNLLKN
jgi:hypothetical protein